MRALSTECFIHDEDESVSFWFDLRTLKRQKSVMSERDGREKTSFYFYFLKVYLTDRCNRSGCF